MAHGAHHSPLEGLAHQIWSKKFVFIATYTLVLFFSLVVLDFFGFAPTSSRLSNVPPLATTTPSYGIEGVPKGQGETPVRIEIPSLGIATTVNNPASSDIATLDSALLSGAVRYPGSAKLGEEGNVLIFGHSSHLPVVYNQAFKAFNDIQKLERGEPIYVIGEGKVYIYAVDNVQEANTADDAIPLAVRGSKLTLATCNNFGSKEDRFIVNATLVNVQDVES